VKSQQPHPISDKENKKTNRHSENLLEEEDSGSDSSDLDYDMTHDDESRNSDDSNILIDIDEVMERKRNKSIAQEISNSKKQYKSSVRPQRKPKSNEENSS